MQQLVLVGAGHAHLAVLARLKQHKLANVQVTLISAQRVQIYSGMVPAWMAGHVTSAQMCIDVVPLCHAAGVRFIQQDMVDMCAEQQWVQTEDHQRIRYDVLSLNTGANTQLSWLAGEQVLPVRPLPALISHWQQILAQAQQQADYQLVVVGAGAAAVELAMAAQWALQKISTRHRVMLLCGRQLLPAFTAGQSMRVQRQLQRLNITMMFARAKSVTDNHDRVLVQLDTGDTILADRVLAATGSAAPSWTAHSQLACSDEGYVAVNAQQQSVSHANVFAVGDIGHRVDQPVARAGVHAVHGGAVLAGNLLAYLQQQPLAAYHPKPTSLYLLACGRPYAVGFWAGYACEGRWVWRVKQWIDRRFVTQYQ